MNATTETIVEKKTITEKNNTYAKIVTNNSDGSTSEIRGYFRPGYTFFFNFTVTKAVNYKNAAKYKGYKAILDSFKTTYNAKDTKLKDISTVKDGYRLFDGTLNGYTFIVPIDWELVEDAGVSFLKGKRSLELWINSKSDGDTLEEWAGRNEADFYDYFSEDYAQTVNSVKGTTGNAPSLTKSYEYSYGNSETWVQTNIYIIKGKYKYQFQYTYFKDKTAAESQAILNKIMKSVNLDAVKTEKAFGYVEEISGPAAKPAAVTVQNSTYKYELDIPVDWIIDEVSTEESIRYQFDGGQFSIFSDSNPDLEGAINSTKESFVIQNEIAEESDETFFDVPVKKFVVQGSTLVHGITGKIAYQSTFLIFVKNDVRYIIIIYIEDWHSTDAVIDEINNTFNSFLFTE